MFKNKVTFPLLATLMLGAGLVSATPTAYAKTVSKNVSVSQVSVVKEITYKNGKLPKKYKNYANHLIGNITVTIYGNGSFSLSGKAATLPPTTSNTTGGQASSSLTPNIAISGGGSDGTSDFSNLQWLYESTGFRTWLGPYDTEDPYWGIHFNVHIQTGANYQNQESNWHIQFFRPASGNGYWEVTDSMSGVSDVYVEDPYLFSSPAANAEYVASEFAQYLDGLYPGNGLYPNLLDPTYTPGGTGTTLDGAFLDIFLP